nr:hypothetical protein CFP56_08765 [Quercus suber]
MRAHKVIVFVFIDGVESEKFLDAQDSIPVTPVSSPNHQWHPPGAQIFKANFDTTVFKSCNLGGIGVIIWDWRGEAIGALTMSVPLPQSVIEFEALACQWVVQFAMEIGLTEVIFEGDSVMVIQAISQGTSDFSAYGHIIEDIRSQAAAFQFSVFCHASRNCNIVADT